MTLNGLLGESQRATKVSRATMPCTIQRPLPSRKIPRAGQLMMGSRCLAYVITHTSETTHLARIEVCSKTNDEAQ